jgi:hypothetical protein
MYDSGDYAVDEIAAAFGVRRSTLYRHLDAQKSGHDCVFVVYRNTRPGKVDADTNRRLGETGQKEEVQREADRKWWPIAEQRWPRVEGFVYVVDGVITRIRGIEPDGRWKKDDRGYVDAPVTKPLTDIARSPSGSPPCRSDAVTNGPGCAARSASTCRYDACDRDGVPLPERVGRLLRGPRRGGRERPRPPGPGRAGRALPWGARRVRRRASSAHPPPVPCRTAGW